MRNRSGYPLVACPVKELLRKTGLADASHAGDQRQLRMACRQRLIDAFQLRPFGKTCIRASQSSSKLNYSS